MAKGRLSKTTVDTMPIPAAGDAFLWDAETRGFGLRVTKGGVRSYVLQYRVTGRPARRLTIGVHGSPWTVKSARAKAELYLAEVRAGVDPVEARRKAAATAADLDVSSYITRFVDGYLKGEWPDTWRTAKRQLETYFEARFKGRSLASIERHEVTAVFDGMRATPAAARNTHAVVRKLFRWAVNRGDIAVSPIADMAAPPAPKPRKRVLTPDEIVAVWRASYHLSAPFGPWLRLLVITLQRRNEVAGLPWTELSQANGLWNLPGPRAKNDNDHIVPLSPLAVAELDALTWSRKGLLFSTTGRTPISSFSKLKTKLDGYMVPIMQEMADERADALGEDREPVTIAPWVFHDLRRTGTTALQQLGIPIEVTERVINHISGETAGIRGVYNLYAYLDEKRAALDAWAKYLGQLIAGASETSNVIAMARSVG
nr:site-specific integrase [Polymorphobacter sp.]